METVELLDVVVGDGYVGAAWEELQRRLVVQAFPDLERAIRGGAIYSRCARAGVRIPRRAELQRHPYPEDIAAEAVEDCLDRFRTRVLPEGQWDPDQRTSLEDFFVACCLPNVANRWRWHLRRLPEYSVPFNVGGEEQVLALHVRPTADPGETVEDRDLVAEALAPMAPVDQTTFVLLAAGWSPEEIARALGIERGALYARMSRARITARTRRTP
jgi:DNA-directed RNA polymerase specialized sigma24 family protein